MQTPLPDQKLFEIERSVDVEDEKYADKAQFKEVEKASLEQKWGAHQTLAGQEQIHPIEGTKKYCHEVATDPELLDDILQELAEEKSNITRKVEEMKTRLKSLESGWP